MDKLKMHSPDISQQNIDKLLELFPNCRTEKQDDEGGLCTGIDFDLLKQELSKNIVEGPQERYQLNWPGKKKALLTANAAIAKTLRPCREESVDFDTTENLFIEGDNLDALKLLQETYLGKVKMIYIDPPYNTGNDFIYKDNFTADKDEYDEASGQRDEDGGRLVANPDSNGRYHSDWLSMMYPRLKLARNLLREDGVIFISIDDNEMRNARAICDEIYGEANFIAEIAWEKMYTTKNDANLLSVSHEYLICYAKSIVSSGIGLLPRTPEMDARYSNPDNDPRGSWKAIPMYADGERKNGRFVITSPTGKKHEPKINSHWRYAEKDVLNLIAENRISFGKTGDSQPNLKRFLSEVRNGVKAKTLWFHKEVGSNDTASREVRELFNLSRSPISFPKPTTLIRRILQLAAYEQDAIILDFFSGSATTAHAVMALNAEDGGKRRHIMIQLPEECDEQSEAYKANYKNIAEISKERIHRAGKKIKEENPEVTNLDTGFRVLKIDSSNMNDVHYTPDSVSKGDLFNQVKHIKTDRSSEDLLFQVMLDWGVDLSLPIRKESIEGKAVYFVNDDDLVACFDKGIDEVLIKALAAEKPLRVVFRDDGFVSDSVKINLEQIFKQLAPATDIKAI
jgi:adenine-specific DNA-methyltransferase